MKHIFQSLAFALLITGCHSADPHGSSEEHPPEIVQAIAAFKTDARYADDYAIPRKLLPLLKTGLSKDEVEEILGEPSKKRTNDVGVAIWHYGLFYSQFIEIEFDPDRTVRNVTSTIETR